MKYVFVSILFLAFLTPAIHAQTKDNRLSDEELGVYYLGKNKRQKTTGWILLGGGLGLFFAGAASYNPFDDNGTSEVVMTIGNLATLASIPLFISAAKNKGRAEILLRHQNVPLSLNRNNSLKLTTVGIAIPLSK